jgi:hypothetical protein
VAEKLNREGFEFAKGLVRNGRVVRDERHDWSEHQPSTERRMSSSDGTDLPNTESGIWVSTIRKSEDTKARCRFHSVTSKIHRCGVSSAEPWPGNVSISRLKAQPRYSTASSPIIRNSRSLGVASSTLPLYPGPVRLVMESVSSKRCRRGAHLS